MIASCPAPLVGLDYPCGRDVDIKGGMGLCPYHTELAGGMPSRATGGAEELQRRPGVPATVGARLCDCGEAVYARGMCYACYHQEYRRILKARRKAMAARGKPMPVQRQPRTFGLGLPCARCGDAVAIWLGGQCRPCWRTTCAEHRASERQRSHQESVGRGAVVAGAGA